MNAQFFDIHHHILFGMDDGARDQQAMFAMLHMAAADGIAHLVATPHAEPGVRHFPQRMYRAALACARDYCQANGLPLQVYEGAEVLYTQHTCRLLQEGKIPTLAGTDRVLVEFSPDISFLHMQRALEQLLGSGYLPVLAHVERYACLVHRPLRAASLKREFPVFFQVNCSTLLSGSLISKHFTARLMDQGLLDAVATDAHNTAGRAVCMTRAHALLQERWGAALADALTSGRLLGLGA